jgi:hypothetical protein
MRYFNNTASLIGCALRVMAVGCLPVSTVYQYCSQRLLDTEPQLFPLQLNLMFLQLARNRKKKSNLYSSMDEQNTRNGH